MQSKAAGRKTNDTYMEQEEGKVRSLAVSLSGQTDPFLAYMNILHFSEQEPAAFLT